MIKKTIKERIESEEDFINAPSCKNSLKELLKKNPEGVDNERIAKVLMMEEIEVEKTFQEALKKIKESMTVGLK
jgi:hypothetical protein